MTTRAGRRRDVSIDQRAALGDEGLERHVADRITKKRVGRIALAEQVLAGREARWGAAGDQLEMLAAHAGERGRLREQIVNRPHRSSLGAASVARIAAASSVMSIATGHQVMQRPQPTHPDVPNWSIQVASLCVIHCR